MTCPEVNSYTGRPCERACGHDGHHANPHGDDWRECDTTTCYLPNGHDGEHRHTDIPVRSPVRPLDLYDPDEQLSPEAEEIAADLFGRMPANRPGLRRGERLKLAAFLADMGYRKVGPADYTVEYRLTGDPGEGYPPFEYVWRGPQAEEGIWKFHRDHAHKWRKSKIERRTAIDTHWERVLTASTTRPEGPS